MPRDVRRTVWSILVFALLIAFAPAAQAQDFSAADKAALKTYVLTAAKVNGFIAGSTALAAAVKMSDALAADTADMENQPSDTLGQLRANVSGHPRVFAYYQRQGLSVDDAVLLPLVLFSAGAAAEFPGQLADVVSPAQVAFVKANAALMERFSAANDALEGRAGDDADAADDAGDDAGDDAEP